MPQLFLDLRHRLKRLRNATPFLFPRRRTMLHRLSALALAVTTATATPAAGAQPAPQASTPAPSFRSALEGYQAFSDQAVAPWREMNDTVGRIGGWRVYAREAQQGARPAQAPAPGPAATSPSPAPAAAKPVPAAAPAAPRHPMHRE